MSRTINTTTTSAGITLSSQSDNPVTIAAGSKITKTSGQPGSLYAQGGKTNTWTIDNFGLISGGSASGGLYLDNFLSSLASGVIINESGGSIAGNLYPVFVNGPVSITNKAGGTISGLVNQAMYLKASANVVNYGIITDAGNVGIYAAGGGSVVNKSGATISAPNYGVRLEGVGTVTNAGTIGGGNDAVLFGVSSTSNALIVDPGASFTGQIDGGGGLLDLAVGNGNAGTLATISAIGITNFSTLKFDAGAKWTVVGGISTTAGLPALSSITGFTSGDTIDLVSFAAVSATYASKALVLTNAATVHATLKIQGSFTSSDFQTTSDKTGGTNITAGPSPRSFIWTNTGTADWNTPSAWDLGSVPTGIDSAVISNAGSNTVTIASGESVAINGVTVGGSDTLSVAGTLSAASIADNALLVFDGSRTLTGTPIALGGTLSQRNVGTLTLGPGELVTQSGASARLASTTTGGETIVNQGTIKAAVAGGSLALVPLVFANQGTVAVTDEALTIGFDDGIVGGTRGSWSNSGLITLSGTAKLTLDGVVTTAGLGTIKGAPTVTLAGVIDNSGTTLSVGGVASELGVVTLTHTGVVSGGTVTDPNGTGFVFNNGVFGGVTYQGPLNIATNGGRLNVQNGLTAIAADGTGAGTINLSEGGDAVLNFLGSQTIDNATINLNGIDSFNPLTEIDIGGGNGPQLTLGPNLTVSSTVGKAQADIRNSTNQDFTSVVDCGTIIAAAPSGSFSISPNEGFTNDGTIAISGGEIFQIEPGFGLFTNAASAAVTVSGNSELRLFYSGVSSQVDNLGVITLGNGSTLDLASGPYTLSTLGSIVNQGATTLFDGTFDGENSTITLGDKTEFNTAVLSGNLRNATIVPNGSFAVSGANASLLNVAFRGPLEVTRDFTNLTINQGVSVTDASGTSVGIIDVSGAGDTLTFANQFPVGSSLGQTLDNVTLKAGNAGSVDTIQASFSGGTFTIGSNATIASAGTGALATLKVLAGATMLDGSLRATGSGGTFTVAGNNFHNNGTMTVGGGDTLRQTNAIVSDGNTGTIVIDANGTFDVGGSFGVVASIAANQTLDFAAASGVLKLRQPAAFAAAVKGFASGDTIDLAGLAATTATWSAGQLTIANGGSSVAVLSLPDDYSAAIFNVGTDGAGGSAVTITATCFAAGTRILTPRGEVAVERLREGDRVLTVSGHVQPIRWIGHRHVDFRQHPNRQRILPVRVTAHAFGLGRPKRDLLLSPDHAVFVEEVLIPVRHLINGSTVAPIERRMITYYHIELPRHDVLLADGMPAESYLEAGARGAFANEGSAMQLHPDFAPPRDRYAMLWELEGCAPLLVAGAAVDRVRQTLAERAHLYAAA